MQTVTITKIARYTTDKSGQPLKSKQGKPYTSVRIQTTEHQERWVSGFGNKENENWKEGDKVEIEIAEKGEYLNFSMPKKEDKIGDGIVSILNAVQTIKMQNIALNEKLDQILTGKKKTPYPTPEDEGIDINNVFNEEPEF